MARFLIAVCVAGWFALATLAAPVPKAKVAMPSEAAVDAWTEGGAWIKWIGEGSDRLHDTPDGLVNPVLNVAFVELDGNNGRLPPLNVPYQLCCCNSAVRMHLFESIPDPKNVVTVTILNSGDVEVSDELIRTMATRFTNVTEMCLRQVELPEGSLAHFKAIPGLRILDLGGSKFSASDHTHLKALKRLEELDLHDAVGLNDDLEFLTGMPQLRKLGLSWTNISSDSMGRLAGLTKLETLDLRHTRVGDEGMKVVGKLQSLRSLNLGQTQVTENGLAHLRGLTELRWLTLPCKVGDDGVAHLTSLKSLRRLVFNQVEVSPTAHETLAKKLPDCKIESDFTKWKWGLQQMEQALSALQSSP